MLIEEAYADWHSKRAELIVSLVEKRYEEMLADDWNESVSTKTEALFSVLRNNPELTSDKAAFIAGMEFGLKANVSLDATLPRVSNEIEEKCIQLISDYCRMSDIT